MEKTVARVALFAALIAALGLVPQIMLPFAGVYRSRPRPWA
ncbi:hypothetical protein [Fodinicurvata halophila]